MINNNLWINKYKPTNLSQVIGNKPQIKIFKEWLENIDSLKNQTIIISGNQGLGKTLIIKLILEEYDYIVRIINPNEIKDYKTYDDFNDYHNFLNSIYCKFYINNTIKNKIALIFDETENITLTSEKKYILDLYKDNKKFKSFPLIFISNNQHSKLLYDLKKNCKEIIFITSSYNELKELILNIYNNEKISIYNNDDIIIKKLINFSQYDIRRLVNLLQELSYHVENNTLYEKNIDEFINKSIKKNTDIGLFETTYNILNNYLDYNIIIKYYEIEKVLLPLMIHENYIKRILNNSNNLLLDNLNRILKISDSISKGDNIETSIYTDQNWYLQHIHGFYTCINTSFWINNNNLNNKLLYDDIKFSTDLNKTSLKNINKKNISNLMKLINNKSIDEILILNKICNHLIQIEKYNTLINILNKYDKNITLKEIELCLKIDKTPEYIFLISKEKKKILKQIKKN